MFKKRSRVSLVPNHLIILFLTIFALTPLVILGFNSVKSVSEVTQNPLGPPQMLQISNYAEAWRVGEYNVTMRNSLILVIGTVFATLLMGGLASYSLARLTPPGSDLFMLYMLIASSLPVWLFMVPLFILWRTLGLINNLFGLILIYTALNAPFSIFLLRSYMVQLPADFEDAARVDGANEIQVFTRVVLPLSWPGFLTVGLVVALGVWNEFQVALIFMSDPKLFPVTTSYYKFTTRFSQDWSLTSAAAVMMILPVLVIFLALQRRFIDGLTQGGLKV